MLLKLLPLLFLCVLLVASSVLAEGVVSSSRGLAVIGVLAVGVLIVGSHLRTRRVQYYFGSFAVLGVIAWAVVVSEVQQIVSTFAQVSPLLLGFVALAAFAVIAILGLHLDVDERKKFWIGSGVLIGVVGIAIWSQTHAVSAVVIIVAAITVLTIAGFKAEPNARLLFFGGAFGVLVAYLLFTSLQVSNATQFSVVSPLPLTNGHWFNPADNAVYSSTLGDPILSTVAMDRKGGVIIVTKNHMYSFVNGVKQVVAVPEDVGLTAFTAAVVDVSDESIQLVVSGTTESGFAQVPLSFPLPTQNSFGPVVQGDVRSISEVQAHPEVQTAVIDQATGEILVATALGDVAVLGAAQDAPYALAPVSVFPASEVPAILVASEVATPVGSAAVVGTNQYGDVLPIPQGQSSQIPSATIAVTEPAERAALSRLQSAPSASLEWAAYRVGTTNQFVWVGSIPAATQVEVNVYYSPTVMTAAQAANEAPARSWTISNVFANRNEYSVVGFAPTSSTYTLVQVVSSSSVNAVEWSVPVQPVSVNAVTLAQAQLLQLNYLASTHQSVPVVESETQVVPVDTVLTVSAQ